jgi:hypothetical protein
MLLQLAPRLHEFCAAPTLSQPAERRFAPVDWFLFLKTKLGWLIRSAILTTILCLCAGLTMAQTLGDDWQKLVNQYSALTKQNRYIDSLDVANKALALAEAKKKTDAPEVALSLLMLANSYTELNQFERALLYQQRGTTISE